MSERIPVEKNKRYILDISRLGHSGEGVGRYKDFTVFVPYALPTEQVEVEITEVKKNYAKGRLIRVLEEASDRAKPDCPIYEKCGGCQYQHVSYTGQLTAKRQQVVDAISRIGKLANVTIHPTLGADNPWYYRNKMQMPVGMAGDSLVMGCFAQATHDIIPTDNCLIQHTMNNVILREVREVLAKFKIPAYDEKRGTGVIRHILGRIGTASNEVMVVLVTATDNLPHKNEIIKELVSRIHGLVSIIQNINPKRTNVIMGDKTTTVWGKDTIVDTLGDFSFHISARSFFQVNTAQAQVLYNKALEYANLTGQETVIDAYCGTGTISLFLASRARKVYGIEIIEAAIRDAITNARQNDIENAEFVVGDALQVMPQLYKQGVRPDVIVVDPPRAGCHQTVLETFVNMKPDRIVYVSCNPASLARDLAILDELGYSTHEIQPVDMFPQTYHVEAIALIQRRTT